MKGKVRAALIAVFALVFAVTGVQLVIHEVRSRQARAEYDLAAQLAGLAPTDPVGEEPLPAVTQPPTQPPTQAPTQAPTQPASDPTGPTETAPTEGPAQPVTQPPTQAPTQPTTQAPTEAPTQPQPLNLAALQAVNPDVVGWISIPDTILSYPLMQGEDNDYYLKRTWKKAYNSLGSIYLDWRCDPALGDDHTIIYGHRMRYDDMFGSLRHYKKLRYWKQHPLVEIVTQEGTYTYRVFAAYETDIDGGHVYRLEIGDKQAWLDACLAASVIDTGVVPGAEDPILTLSTCTAQGSGSRARWVVQAVLEGTA